MTASEQITLEPAFALMLAQHLHHAAIGGDVVVASENFRRRATIRDLEHRAPAVRGGFVRAEDAEVMAVLFHNVADELTLDAGGFALRRSRL